MQNLLGVEVNAADVWGTALIVASSESHTDIVHMLLQAGADANSADRYGNNALIYAALKGDF